MIKLTKLSEANLCLVLKELYPYAEINPQTRIKVDGKLLIVDYEVVYGARLIYIEFDGPTHYTDPKTQIRDINLERYCKENNITLIRIPYFVQLNEYNLTVFFDHVITTQDKVCCEYPSGFIDSKIIYPGAYNRYGFNLFFKQFKELDWYTAGQIASSLLEQDKNVTVTLGLEYSCEEYDLLYYSLDSTQGEDRY
jgi:hypothetical protein